MKKVTEGVWFIQGQDEFIPDAHAYVIGKPDSEDLSLVDAGLMGKGPYKIDAVQRLGIDLTHIKRVIMTHTHLDHIGCLADILKAIPGAELWVHGDEAGMLEEGDERAVYGMDMFQSLCHAQYGIEPGAFKFNVDRQLEGGEVLDLGGIEWQVIHIPGHSQGSIGLYNQDNRILIPGDVVYADYAIGRFDLFGASGPKHKESLVALGELEVSILLPGHNRIMESVPPGYITETAEQWGPYLT
ncbi:MAG: MBL fold metallo-hydrolase [Deltaproteobacteria bacterium]|nr:MBL fold metallo-hydrolase [Deltaproteobacteria bacterium]MBW1818691.1 MBL fold metallo-hydrolase [Deltaproteobacteria bacterium]MBW2285594.1 MBL fold metallo-hydrolase [Deltaproteobacteria bacterium]